MTDIRCLIVDDESIAQRIIVKYLNDLSGFEVVGTCLNAIEAIAVLEKENVDLMFLDIEMPKLKGLAFLKTLNNPPHVIITTAHREYALEGYELEVLDYLLKPISFERFIKAINRFKKINPSKGTPDSTTMEDVDSVIYIKSNRKTIKLSKPDISYIEGMNNYIIIHIDGERHIVYQSITETIDQLGSNFIRIHKSYVINCKKVKSFTKEQVNLDGVTLPIGKTYKGVVDRL